MSHGCVLKTCAIHNFRVNFNLLLNLRENEKILEEAKTDISEI